MDIGLIEGNINDSSLNKDYFLKDKLSLALPYDENLSNNKLDTEKIQNCKWIIRENGSGTREYIDLPELVTFEDYTNIEVLTEVKPSKIELEYTGYTIVPET